MQYDYSKNKDEHPEPIKVEVKGKRKFHYAPVVNHCGSFADK